MPFTLTAANDLLIEFDAERWSLLLPSAPATPIIQADAQLLRYASAFGIARRLSTAGVLRPDQVSMVVVGYSADDRNWHLGLMLDSALAQGRGGRWCEIAQWPEDEDADAETAGRNLSSVIGRPFRLVTPQAPVSLPAATASAAYAGTSTAVEQHPAQDTLAEEPSAREVQEAEPAPPVKPLPLTFGDWTVSEILGGTQWNRTRKWRNEQIVRGLFFCALAPLFGILSIGALTSQFASVQPIWLPWVGVALASIMLIIGLSSFFAIGRSPVTTIDRRIQLLRQSHGRGQKVVQSPFEGLEYVLVSHAISRQQPIDDQLLLAILDVWVHVHSPRRGFILVCSTDGVEAQLQRKLEFNRRRPLNLAEIDSQAHHAAVHLGEDIGVPVFVEER